MLSRLWLLISLAWMGFCFWGFSAAELRHMTIENYAILFAPFLIRLAVLFVVFGIPRSNAPRRSPR